MSTDIEGQPRMRKIGQVMWEETESGYMKPKGLENPSENDLINLNKIYEAAMAYKKVKPILQIISNRHWDDILSIRGYLHDSLTPRAEARMMKASDDWDTYWRSLV